MQEAPAGPLKQSDLTERMSLMSLTDSVSLSNLSKLRPPRANSNNSATGSAADRDASAVRDSTDKLAAALAPGDAKSVAGVIDGMKGRVAGAPGVVLDQPVGTRDANGASRQTAGGALAAAAAAAAGGSLSKLANITAANGNANKPLSQQVVGQNSSHRRGPSNEGIGHPDGALTKGVRAHAVNLSTTTLTH